MNTQNNPYAPPKTQELEPPPEPAAENCVHVEWACKLMWVGFAVSTLDSILSIFTEPANVGAEIFGAVIGLGISFAIVYWFTLKLSAGRNWMRLLVTILTAVGFGFLVLVFAFLALSPEMPSLLPIIQENPLQLASMVVQMALSVAEVVLINTPTSRAWFEAKKYAD